MIEIYGSPWRTWWKARKYFRFPNIRLSFTNTPHLYFYYWSWYDFIYISDVNWKNKYNSARFEDNPMIVFNFFNMFQFKIEFGRWLNGRDYSMEYWEAIINYVYFNFSLHQSLSYSIWENYVTKEKTPITKICLWKH